MESMLTTASAKMTGLDLGGKSQNSRKMGNEMEEDEEEMLKTPKFPPESAGSLLLSPRGFPAHVPPKSAKNNNADSGGSLTTPNMLTTPKTGDMWKVSSLVHLQFACTLINSATG